MIGAFYSNIITAVNYFPIKSVKKTYQECLRQIVLYESETGLINACDAASMTSIFAAVYILQTVCLLILAILL